MDDQILPKIGGKTAQVTGRADKAWVVAHYYVARLMRAAVGGGKLPLLKVSPELRCVIYLGDWYRSYPVQCTLWNTLWGVDPLADHGTRERDVVGYTS